MPGSLLGTRVRRLEDPELLTGQGTYVGNMRFQGGAHAAFVRSPFAHALINRIDTSAAAAAPGVLAVYTAEDLGVEPFHGFMVLNPSCPRPPLAVSKVRFVGDPVAIVVAENEAAALDACELVEVDYEPLDAVVDMEAALDEGAPMQFEEIGSNLAAGMSGAGDPLAGASRVIRARLQNQRVAVVPMEGDAIAAIPGDDGQGHDLTVYVATQMPHMFAMMISRHLGVDMKRLRVVAPHVGGGFGAKAGLGAEHAAVIVAAQRLERPVSWVQTRSDNMVAMPHGRGQVQWVEMGFDEDARITGMRLRVIGDCGAYAGFGGALAIGPTQMMAQGVYDIPAIRYDVAAALTNTTPVGAFRGAGRPEAAELLERMMDLAAAELGVDPLEIRRRNLLAKFESSVTTKMGTSYDTGDYEAALESAVQLAGYEDLRQQQSSRRASGDRWQIGIGIAVYVEITAGGMNKEFASVEVHPDGKTTIRAGTSAHGQGHATSFAMIVSDRLGIPMDDIGFVQSDTAAVPRGTGTGGSRSLQVGGSAVLEASQQVLTLARDLVAEHLEASPEDIVVHDSGGVGVAGVPASAMSWADVARLAASSPGAGGANEGMGPLAAAVDIEVEGATFPFGAHVSVVEVDTETGYVRPLRHIAVDDCGRIVNPLLVTGQQHGGIGQGMAQALWEEVVFDADGNPLTANLADYGMPSAAELPSFETANTVTPTGRNPLGAKGIGESGTIGSTPSVHNAVIDALSHLGVRHIDMPCTPQRVWEAIVAAGSGSPASRPLWTEPPSVFDRLPLSGGLDEAGSEAAAGI